jgi:hypothetical protein
LEEGREGVEPSRDGFAIRCLSHLATAPSEIRERWAEFREPTVPDFYNECIGRRSRLLEPIPGEISEEAIWAFFGTSGDLCRIFVNSGVLRCFFGFGMLEWLGAGHCGFAAGSRNGEWKRGILVRSMEACVFVCHW